MREAHVHEPSVRCLLLNLKTMCRFHAFYELVLFFSLLFFTLTVDMDITYMINLHAND